MGFRYRAWGFEPLWPPISRLGCRRLAAAQVDEKPGHRYEGANDRSDTRSYSYMSFPLKCKCAHGSAVRHPSDAPLQN